MVNDLIGHPDLRQDPKKSIQLFLLPGLIRKVLNPFPYRMRLRMKIITQMQTKFYLNWISLLKQSAFQLLFRILIYVRRTLFLFYGFSLLFTSFTHAYDFQAGDMVLRPLLGVNINVIRLDKVTRESPGATLVIGTGFDYSFSDAIALSTLLKLQFSSGYLGLGADVGVKYHVYTDGIPLIPYGALYLGQVILFPLKSQPSHYNIGMRIAGGVDYFILRHVALGLDLSVFPNVVFTKGYSQFELAVDVFLGVSWRF